MPKITDLFAELDLKPDKGSFSAGDRLISGIKTALAGLVAIRTAKFFGDMVTDTARTADQFAKMSKQIGVSIEGLQQLEFAAQISGASIDDLRVALPQLAQKAEDTRRGSQEMAATFSALGVEVTDANNQLRPLEDILLDTADGLAGMDNETKRTALAVKLFGDSGAKLLPLLTRGEEGIRQLRDEFVELGGQISSENAAQFEDFNDDMLRFKTTLIGVRNQAVVALLPFLKEMAQNILTWVKANRDLLRQRLVSFFKGLVVIVKAVGGAIALAVTLIGKLSENAETLKIGLIALAVAFGVVKTGGVAAAIAVGLAWVKAALPFVVIGAIIGGIILVVQDLWSAFRGGPSLFRDLWESFKSIVVDKVLAAIEFLEKKLREFFDMFSTGISGTVGGVVRTVVGDEAADTLLKNLPGAQGDSASAQLVRATLGGDSGGRAPGFFQNTALAPLRQFTNPPPINPVVNNTVTVNGVFQDQLVPVIEDAVTSSQQRAFREALEGLP